MNPFKGVSGRRCKRMSKPAMVEVKQEPGIKEEPNDDDCGYVDVMEPILHGRCRVNCGQMIELDDDFGGVKDEIKCEGDEDQEMNEENHCCEPLSDHDANEYANNDQMGVANDGQAPKPVRSGKKRNGSLGKQSKRPTPRSQAAKKQKKHKCHVCNHLARNNYRLKEHLRTHTGEKPFKCDVCLKTFAQKNNLHRHKKTHGPKPKFRCLKCKQGFEQEPAKIDHERVCCIQQFVCDICGYHTMNMVYLTSHMRTHSGEKPFECSICFKSFGRKFNLQKHSMTHKDELPNVCSKCKQRFATPEAKQTHEARCQRDLFACNQCQYKAIHRQNLNRHMQSKHGAKRSFECEICRKQFVQQFHLNQHLSAAHSDQFPFECSKCFGGYATEDAKEVHEDSCGYRQYQCHLCKKYRRDKQQLKIHMRKHHTGERIRCKICAARFVGKSNADRHMKTVHRLKKN